MLPRYSTPRSVPLSRSAPRWRRFFKSYRNPILLGALFLLLLHHFYFSNQDSYPTGSRIYGHKNFKSSLGRIQHKFGPEPKNVTLHREARREAVRDAFLHAWKGYKTYAFGHDEVRPLTNTSKDPFGGWGATLVDALSTMLVMELNQEFEETREAVAAIDFSDTFDYSEISVFETIIRYMGGLISAYELSGDDLMLEKAKELGVTLLPAFDTATGMPWGHWNITSYRLNVTSPWVYPRKPGVPRRGTQTYIAEIGTLQLEFIRLSEHTGDPIYASLAQNLTDMLDNMGIKEGLHIPGLYPTAMDVQLGTFVNTLCSFGGTGDSVFEYFIKEYLLVDGAVPQYARMYIESIEGMKNYMLFDATQNDTDYIFLGTFDTRYRTSIGNMDHLSCFVPGMLAIGSRVLNRPEDLEIAKGIIETCVLLYSSTATGLAPESWSFIPDQPYIQRTWANATSSVASTPTPTQTRQPAGHLHLKRAPPPMEVNQEVAAAEEEEEEEDQGTTEGDEAVVMEEVENEEEEVEEVEEVEGEGDASNDWRLNKPRYGYKKISRLPNGESGSQADWQNVNVWSDSYNSQSLFFVQNSMYILRPETVESLYILYRVTGDTKYQEYGWNIFQALERHCKTPVAYSALRNVNVLETIEEYMEDSYFSNYSDSMESFFLAETLKYLYLLFSPPDVISLDKFIFNTEAHPFMRMPVSQKLKKSLPVNYVGPVKQSRPSRDDR